MRLRLLTIVLLAIAIRTYGQIDTAIFAYQKPLSDFDYNKTIFKLDEGQQNNKQRFLRSSVLTGYREGVKPISGSFGMNFEFYTDPITGTRRVAMYNLSIVEMLNLFPVDPRKVVLNVKNSSKYMYLPEYGDRLTWLRKNSYCFEYTMPEAVIGKGDGQEQLPFRTMLEQMLGVRVKSETRPLKVLVLYRISNVDKIKSKGINTGANGTIDEKGTFRMSKPIHLSFPLNVAGYPLLVDETGYKGFLDMDLNISNWKDFNEVRKALQRYDLDLKEEIRPVKDIMVVTEINQK